MIQVLLRLAAPLSFRSARIDHQNVDRIGTDQRIADVQRVLTAVRLRNQQIVDVDADLLRVARIDRMLRIDDRALAAFGLRIRNHMQTDSGLAA